MGCLGCLSSSTSSDTSSSQKPPEFHPSLLLTWSFHPEASLDLPDQT